MHQIIDDYWISRSKSLRAEPKSGNAPAVWAYTSFIEALAEAYRLFPDDATISKTYKDALVGLESYAVTSNITTPSGRYKVTYYNATKGGQGDYYYIDKRAPAKVLFYHFGSKCRGFFKKQAIIQKMFIFELYNSITMHNQQI